MAWTIVLSESSLEFIDQPKSMHNPATGIAQASCPITIYIADRYSLTLVVKQFSEVSGSLTVQNQKFLIERKAIKSLSP